MKPIKPTKPRIFVFCRAYLIPDFQENLTSLTDEFEFKFLTDGRNKFNVTDTRNRFYERLDTATTPDGFSVKDELDVIARCRYLRNLPHIQAIKMLRAMASVIEEELDLYNPQAILAQMVDEYITHLLSNIAKVRGIVYVGYIYSYFPNMAQVVLFSDGSPLSFRNPPEEEVTKMLEDISQDGFRQNYKQNTDYSKIQHLKLMLRFRVKQVAFKILAWRDNDPLNIHYACLPYIVERRHWHDLPSANDFDQNWDALIINLRYEKAKPIIYFPLAYFPESSTDYWVENKELLDYVNYTLALFKFLSKSFTVVVKEHMHMLGGRDVSYYHKIKEISGVISVPPYVNSNDVVLKSDAVIVGGGSVGIESFLRHKPILTFCTSSCWYLASGATKLDLSDIATWQKAINETIYLYKPPTLERKKEFIKQCLKSTIRIKKSGKLWPICNSDDVKNLLNTAISVKFTDVIF